MRVLISGVILLSVWGCDGGRAPTSDVDPDGAVGTDGGAGADGQVRDGRVDGAGAADLGGLDAAGAAVDGRVADGGAVDGGVRDAGALDAGALDASALDAGGEPAGFAPDPGQVALAEAGGTLYLAWVELGALWLRRASLEGVFQEPGRVWRLGAPAHLEALGAGDAAWVVVSGAGVAQVLRADQPDAPPQVLPVRGRVLLATVGPRLWVVGADAAGHLAWVVLDPDGSISALQVDPLGRPPADGIAVTSAGVVLRFDRPGQCLVLSAQTAEITGHFTCGWGPGQLISDGAQAMRVDPSGGTVEVSGLLDPEGSFLLGMTREAGWHLPSDGTTAVLSVASTLPGDGNRQGRVEVLAAQRGALWRSDATWLEVPWPTARAAYFNAGRLLVFVFGYQDGPRVESVGLRPFRFPAAPYGIDEAAACTPEVVVCDGGDEDCDGQIDEGQCCNDPARASTRLFRPVPGAAGPVQQVLLTDVQRQDAYHLALRVAEDRWVGKLVFTTRGPAGLPDIITLEGFDIRGAYEGRALVAAGGHNLLIARDAAGVWTAFWHYRGPVRPPEPLGCTDVLDADVADHFADAAQGIFDNSVLIVCPDRIIKAYPEGAPDFPGGRPNEVYAFQDLGLPAVRWATITRLAAGVASITVGFVDNDGGWWVQRFTFTALLNRLEADGVAMPGGAWGSEPVVGAPNAQRLDVQLVGAGRGGVRAGVLGDDASWMEVLTTPSATAAAYAGEVGRVVVAGSAATPEGEPATGFWVVPIGRPSAPALWSTEPAVVWPGADPPWWTVSRGDYSDFLVLVTPVPGAPNYALTTHRIGCTAP